MSKTILLADDSVTIQKVVELSLMDDGHKVVAFSNGDDALAMWSYQSPDVGNSSSLAALGVAAHEAGHALQHAQNDPAMALRQAIVPVAQIGSGIAPWLIIAGLIFNLTGLALVGLVFFGIAGFFWFFWPLFDRGDKRSPLVTVVGVGALAFIAVMTFLGYVGE